MEKTEVMLHEELHSMIKSSDSFSEVNSHIDTIMIKIDTIEVVVQNLALLQYHSYSCNCLFNSICILK
jgi:hypothetical protein